MDFFAKKLLGPLCEGGKKILFIGCNTALIAPLQVGSGAYIGAGSTITEDVPAQALGIARARQSNKKEWAAKHKK